VPLAVVLIAVALIAVALLVAFGLGVLVGRRRERRQLEQRLFGIMVRPR